MSKAAIPTRLPWEERWARPTLEQLLKPQKDQVRAPLTALIEQLGELEGVEQDLVWYGPAWKWTIQFRLADEADDEGSILTYVVPNPETPLVSVPLRDETVEQLPIRRLNKYIRDGIRSAKQAVELHWAVWTPTSQSDAEHLLDLIKRKHKIRTGEAAGNGHSNGNGKKK